MKRRMALALAAAMAASMFAGVSEAQAADGDSLIVSWWGNQTRNERTQTVLDTYAADNGLTIDGQFAEWADYWNKLATASAGHSLPDVVQMDYSYLAQYVSNGLLVDLTPYIEDGTIDTTGIDQSIIDSGSIDGKVYAISLGSNVPAVMYNKTLLDENGITIEDNMTLDQFEDVCREVYEKTGYKTDVFYQNGDAYLQYYLRGEGAQLYADEGGIGATVEQLTDWFNIYKTGIDEGWMVTPDVYAERTIGTPEQMPLVYGSSPDTMAWCAFSWSNSLASLQAAAPEGTEIALTTWPSNDPAASDYIKPSMFFCITTDSANPDAAAAFINYWTNDVDCNKVLLAERGIPVSTSVADEVYDALDADKQQVISFINDVVTPNSSTIDPAGPDGSAEVVQMIKDLTEEVCYGATTPEDAAQKLLDEGNAALGQ